MRRYIFTFCASLIAASTCAAAAKSDAVELRIPQVENLVPAVLVKGEAPALVPLSSRMAELKVPGVSLAVIHKGRIDWARGYGVKSIGGAAVDENTLFQAASISKPVFALAVLHQVDAGKLALDTNVNDYLETWQLPDNEFTREQKVTLRRLLSHSAGLTVHGFAGYEAGAQVPTTVQVLDGAPPANSPPIRVDVAPGSINRYSGGGFTLAQLVVQDVTGTAIPDLMRDTVLKPLGMTRSTYEQPLPANRLAEVALPYRADGTPVTGGPHVYPEMAAAGLWTTPSDLARYALGVRAALAGKSKVISAARAREMLTPVIGQQGLGPQVGGSTARKYFMHNGGNEGYRCVLVTYEDGEGAAIMTSGDNGGGLMYEVLRTVAQVYGWPDFGPASRTLVTVDPKVLDRLIGVYELADKSVYVVRRQDNQLVGNIIGNGPIPLFPAGETELFARNVDVVVNFTADSGGAVNSLKHRVNGFERPGQRVAESRAREVMASVERADARFKAQKADPRAEPAVRKLFADLANGKPDYDTMAPALAEVTRQQLPGIQGFLSSLGELQTLAFQRVGESGADEYLARFAKGVLNIEVGLDDAGRLEIVNVR